MRNIKSLRLKNYDYKENGYYFVTICTNRKNNLLIDTTKDVVARFIEQIPMKMEGVSIDYYTIMPNHAHIIFILNGCKIKLGEVVRQLKAVCSKEIGCKLWQPNYYEHVIRNDRALEKIREYTLNNPEVEKMKFEEFYAR